MSSRLPFPMAGVSIVIALAAGGMLACDNPPPPASVTNPGGTFITGFLDFGDVPVGTASVEQVYLAPGRGVSSPAVVHLDIEDVPGDTNNDLPEFSLSLDGGVLAAPCLIAVTFKPDHVASQNDALLAYWFTLPDGGTVDRSGYVLRATSVVPGTGQDGGLDGGPDGGADAGPDGGADGG